jgi:hypothetical protein
MTFIYNLKEGTGTRPDYLRIVLTNKIEGPLLKKIARKSRNGRRVNGGCVGAHGQLTQGANWSKSQNQIQPLKEYLCCHIYCAQLGAPWGKIVGASESRALSNRESRYLPYYQIAVHSDFFLVLCRHIASSPSTAGTVTGGVR